jgi:hypothetical protein
MSKIQSILFNKDEWDIFDSHQWLIQNNIYPVKSPHVTKKFIRYRIKDPNKFKRLRTIKTDDGIDLIIGFY